MEHLTSNSRVMLGRSTSSPDLLVEITKLKNPRNFDFLVINGLWDGTFTDGKITIWHPSNPWSSLDSQAILCTEQDRLRGNYQDVFDNFSDKNYVAPKPVFQTFADFDDDIPF